jgi:predicted nucleic acid-binding protein
MILVDTSVWADHIRRKNEAMADLMNDGQVLIHPFVIGELALGNLENREIYLSSLNVLPTSIVATDEEVMSMIESKALFGSGIGYIHVHLLASASLSRAKFWTNDKRLHSAAIRLGLA